MRVYELEAGAGADAGAAVALPLPLPLPLPLLLPLLLPLAAAAAAAAAEAAEPKAPNSASKVYLFLVGCELRKKVGLFESVAPVSNLKIFKQWKCVTNQFLSHP